MSRCERGSARGRRAVERGPDLVTLGDRSGTGPSAAQWDFSAQQWCRCFARLRAKAVEAQSVLEWTTPVSAYSLMLATRPSWKRYENA